MQFQFDATNIAPDPGVGSPIPTAWYNLAIDKSEMKPTKDGNGAYLALRFSVLDGQYQGRKVFMNFNTQHPNPQVVDIAYKQLSAVLHAIGVLRINQTEELHGKPLRGRVRLNPPADGYDANNTITSYKHINDPSAVDNAPAGQPRGPMAAPGGMPAPTAPPYAPPPAMGQPGAWAPPPQAAPQPAMGQPASYPPQGQPAQPWQQQQPAMGQQPAQPAQPWQQPAQQPAQQFQQPAQQPQFAPPPQQAAPAPAAAPAGFAPPWATAAPAGGAAPQQPWSNPGQ